MELVRFLQVELGLVSAGVHSLINRTQLLAQSPRRRRLLLAHVKQERFSVDASFLQAAQTLQLLEAYPEAIAYVRAKFGDILGKLRIRPLRQHSSRRRVWLVAIAQTVVAFAVLHVRI